MRIQHNIMAMNAYRNYTSNVNAMKSNLEKLSSGYKINRAGDDAAGLAISEKMRAQITGLSAAQKNVKDGISLVQTAEGAMQEVQDMLNRMVYLATQSANGTYQNEVDRENLQKELDQLKEEIDRIADSSNFNGIKLLDGSMEAEKAVGTTSAVTVSAVNDGSQGQAEVLGKIQINLSQFEITDTDGATATDAIKTLTLGGAKFQKGGADLALTIAATDSKISGSAIAAALNGTTITIDNIEYDVKDAGNGIVELTSKTGEDVTAFGTTDLDFVVETETDKGTVNQGEGKMVHIIDTPVAATDSLLAQAEFSLTADMIKDGASINIGGTSYTFAVGKDSKVAGANVIDLKKSTATGDELVKEAAALLSQQSNDKFIITTNGTDGTIGLTEKKGKVDYKTEWDLKGTAADQDGNWNTKVGSTDKTTGVVTFTSAPTVSADAKTGLTLQIGDTADSFNQLNVSIGDIHISALGLTDVKISKQDLAQNAISAIKDAINTVSSIRGDLGATQNRLEHTANNLSVMQENITDAESSIRDTDVAEEMMAYTKNNILIQSAQAMLAQANQVPQGVLQLLQ